MKRILPLLICLVLLWSCATEGPVVKTDHDVLEKSSDISAVREPSAEEMLNEALTLITLPGGTADDTQKARKILAHINLSYPDSKWVASVEAMILLIDRQTACAEKIKEYRSGCEGILSQKLKCEESGNMCRQELTRILQENEQLKKDLQNLKNLEIELEQRTRKMR
ncbi:MAG: hypothetical protein JW902_08025 [Syntrophaceae bacterium]|nr:hypothetical protein [Syntrophaceae bacterium]